MQSHNLWWQIRRSVKEIEVDAELTRVGRYALIQRRAWTMMTALRATGICGEVCMIQVADRS